MFKALVVDKDAEGKVSASITDLSDQDLPAGDVTVAVDYSTINYKDGLVLNGLGNLVKTYPHVPGIDFAGTVEQSDHPDYKPGDQVILTGWRVGEIHWGGLAQKARVKGDWLVKRPADLTAQQAMTVGTAGFTAMLAVLALEKQGLTPDQGEVLVTGATGGVGSVAVAILAKLGYQVAALTGKASEADYLKSLGASTIIDRAELSEESKRPLESERWAGCIDSVGGVVLARALAQMKYGGAVAAIGLAGSPKLPATVLPFILRNVALLGIDSVMAPLARRQEAWARIASDLPLASLEAMATTVPLAQAVDVGGQILQGAVRGRVIVDTNAVS
jgi:acrylyl-CoA reductase (NADPH)